MLPELTTKPSFLLAHSCCVVLIANQKRNEKQCDKFWEQAKDWVKEIGFEMSQLDSEENWDIDQIHVKKSDSETIICYKKENLLIKGWCKTYNWQQQGGWGICSESCKYLKYVVEGTSGGYSKV